MHDVPPSVRNRRKCRHFRFWPIADIRRRLVPLVEALTVATITLYRPIGTVERTLIEALSWRAFPAMPHGHQFYAYLQPPCGVLQWKERLQNPEKWDYIFETGQREVVESWDAWGNSPTCAFIVAFELDEHSPLSLSRWDDRSYDVDGINSALVGPISLYERSGTEE